MAERAGADEAGAGPGDGVSPDRPWWTGPSGDRRRYRVARPEPLAGGQGYVFEARRGAEPVSLKLLQDVSAEDEHKLRERLDLVRRHPHRRLARPIEVFRGPGLFRDAPPPDEDADLLYVATTWAPGQALGTLAPLPVEDALTVIEDVAAAVVHLHEACGFVHRDLHAGNVVVDDDGHAVLIDLGSVRRADGAATTTVAGSLGFIAPERTHGVGDRRSDSWGIGMILVFALLGRPQRDLPVDELVGRLRAVLGVGDVDRLVASIVQMVDPDPTRRPADAVAWVAGLREAASRRPRRTGGRTWARPAVAAAAFAVAAATAAAALAMATDDEPSTSPATTGDAAGPELLPPGPSCPFDLDLALAVAARGACASGPLEEFGAARFQAVVGGGHPDGVVVQAPGSGPVRLTSAQWASYREIVSRQAPETAVDWGGYPVAVRDDLAPGAIAVVLSGTGFLLGPRDDTQSFWMPDQVVEVWERTGGLGGPLGLPMSNPHRMEGGFRQDFAGGHMELSASDTPVDITQTASDALRVVVAEDPAAPLRPLGDLRGRIVRQRTVTAWHVDATGRRRWIADGPTWSCLGGDDRVAIEDAPGSAVATLPLGPPATCPG